MNLRLLAKLLSTVCLLIAVTMVFSLPWALPILNPLGTFEKAGFFGLCGSIAATLAVALGLRHYGQDAKVQLFRKEAMAVVGLSWVLATILGALPYVLSGTSRSATEKMDVADAIFESQSGFSTTGATVITDLENPRLVPRCILFWRSSTHFLGGLGIIVLFVVVLGQGSAGKALMRAEMPGPTKDGTLERMQHTAWLFAGIYCGLNLLLAVIFLLENMSLFDAVCHAFGTMATGGFSTYNASLGHFATQRQYNGPLIEYTVIVFMILAGTNFALLYFLIIGQPKKLFADVEWRTYLGIIIGVTTLVVATGVLTRTFDGVLSGIRYGLFQVVSIVTTTGYGTHDFDQWSSVGRGVLFLLMFVGGCAGSTGGGLKVIRHILFLKILRLEVEQAFHPTVVRPLRLGGEPIEAQELRKNILVYFGLILAIFVFSWMLLITIEPDETWLKGTNSVDHKLIDSASGIASTLNNIGPGLGTIGATRNYAHFSPAAKILFTWLMMVGRLEIFAVLVLFVPSFWRDRS